jgi:hypothetical protein
MSNSTPPPAPHVVAIDDNARWLFPLERAPPPPRDEGCTSHGLSDPAPLQSNCSLPPSPPILMTSPLPSSHTSSTCAATSPTQTVHPPDRDTASLDASSNALSERMNDSLRRFLEEISEASRGRITEDLQHHIAKCDEHIRQIDECLIKDMKPTGAFIRIKEVSNACTAPLDAILAEIAHDEMVHKASRLSTTTAHSLPSSANKKMTLSPPSTETMSSYSTPPPPYLFFHGGKYTLLMGGGSIDVDASTPCVLVNSCFDCRHSFSDGPGRRHRPRAPEAIPSHPVPSMGGTTMPTRTNSSARATAICHSTSPHTVTVPPSHQPFIICCTGAG